MIPCGSINHHVPKKFEYNEKQIEISSNIKIILVPRSCDFFIKYLYKLKYFTLFI